MYLRRAHGGDRAAQGASYRSRYQFSPGSFPGFLWMKRSRLQAAARSPAANAARLPGRLQAGRGKPLAHVCGGFSLPGQPDQSITRNAWRGFARFFSKAFRLFCQTLIQRDGLFETASFHGAAPFPWEEGGSATGVLIADKSHGPGGDLQTLTPFSACCLSTSARRNLAASLWGRSRCAGRSGQQGAKKFWNQCSRWKSSRRSRCIAPKPQQGVWRPRSSGERPGPLIAPSEGIEQSANSSGEGCAHAPQLAKSATFAKRTYCEHGTKVVQDSCAPPIPILPPPVCPARESPP